MSSEDRALLAKRLGALAVDVALVKALARGALHLYFFAFIQAGSVYGGLEQVEDALEPLNGGRGVALAFIACWLVYGLLASSGGQTFGEWVTGVEAEWSGAVPRGLSALARTVMGPVTLFIRPTGVGPLAFHSTKNVIQQKARGLLLRAPWLAFALFAALVSRDPPVRMILWTASHCEGQFNICHEVHTTIPPQCWAALESAVRVARTDYVAWSFARSCPRTRARVSSEPPKDFW